jgi:hypothetical protein
MYSELPYLLLVSYIAVPVPYYYHHLIYSEVNNDHKQKENSYNHFSAFDC